MNTAPGALTMAAEDLVTGDRLLRLGGVGYAQLRDPDAEPVLVADVRPPLEPTKDADSILEVATSAGTIYVRRSAPALVARDDAVTPATILLISRRSHLHANLTKFGVPVVRRTPVAPGKTIPAVTAEEWVTAPLIVIDGYLSATTLTAMWQRGDLIDRDEIVMVGTDPDDVRLFGRQARAHARLLCLLPYDKASLSGLFHAAVYTDRDHDPYLGVLTPRG